MRKTILRVVYNPQERSAGAVGAVRALLGGGGSRASGLSDRRLPAQARKARHASGITHHPTNATTSMSVCATTSGMTRRDRR